MDNMSLADIAAVTRGENEGVFGGGGMWIFALLILLLIGGGNGVFGGGNDFGRFATAASQSEILLGQQFQGLDNKIDRIGNGIADSTFALNNAIVGEGRATQTQLCGLSENLGAKIDALGGMIQQNKIDSLQNEVNTLKTQSMLCGVPKVSPYMYGITPNCGCGCNGMNF